MEDMIFNLCVFLLQIDNTNVREKRVVRVRVRYDDTSRYSGYCKQVKTFVILGIKVHPSCRLRRTTKPENNSVTQRPGRYSLFHPQSCR